MNRKYALALLLGAAVSACSSERDDDASRTTNQPITAAPATPDTAGMAGMHHDTGQAATAHDTAAHSTSGHAAPVHTPAHAAAHNEHKPAAHAGMTAREHRAMASHEKMPVKHDATHATALAKHDPTHAAPMKHDPSHAAPMKHDSAHAAPAAKHDPPHAAAPAQHDTAPARAAAPADHAAHADHAAPAPGAPTDHEGHAATESQDAHMSSDMLMAQVGPVTVMGMAQAFPAFTFALPGSRGTPLERTGVYLTQPAVMINASSPNERWVLRTTLNFEGLTQPDGELTFGGWGEGFLDKRHPHTLLHEFMLSWNTGSAWKGFSISAGKGFAPYGTDDPMSRPILKYPTNHHLSQALERWTLSSVLAIRSWGIEALIFGGQEPEGPYDLSNLESFGNSWSARVTKRYGTGTMGTWPWEFSASYANIVEEHHEVEKSTALYNVAVRHDHEREGVPHYALVEYSRSSPEDGDGYFSLLGEGSVKLGRHQPYGRVEYATRPEYERDGPRGSDQFFRYDHDSHAIGSTRWLIATAGYGFVLGSGDVSPRPFIEAQYNRVLAERGGIDPSVLFGRSSFWSISAGMRVFVGGEPMRMGTYGILYPMTAMHKMPDAHAGHAADGHAEE